MFGKSECHRIHSLLWDYAGSGLSLADRERVAQHLLNCPACRARAEDEARIREYVAAYRQQPVPLAPPAWLELRDAISVEPARGIATGLIPRQRLVTLLCASALIAGAVLFFARQFAVPPLQKENVTKEIVTKGHGDSRQELARNIHSIVPDNPQPHNRLNTTRGPSLNIQPEYLQPHSRSIRPSRTPDLKRTPSAVATSSRPHWGAGQAAPDDDMHYVNTGSVDVLADWTAMPPDQLAALKARIDRTARRGDDFVQVTMPLLASRGDGGVQAAAEAYKHEKEIVDARLAHKVTLVYKAMPFREVCRSLRKLTGIDLKANQTVADEKVTLFCDDCSLRDIMRQITHVFAFSWVRSGTEGEFAYELLQDVRSRIAEEELRNRDRNASLIALADNMERYRPYLDMKPDQLREAARKAEPDKAKLLLQMAGPVWGGIQCYFSLTGEQRDALFNDQEIRFSANPIAAGIPLTPDMNRALLQASGVQLSRAPDGSLGMAIALHGKDPNTPVPQFGTPAEDWPGAYAMIGLQLDRPELGRLVLSGKVSVFVASPGPNGGGGTTTPYHLAEGVSPSVAGPENATWNRALRNLPGFKRIISLTPRHICPRPEQGVQAAAGGPPITDLFGTELTSQPHITSADIWEEVHRQTGMPIIADAYTHLYAPPGLAPQKVSVFDALCQDGDAMNVRWKKEDAFLQCRSMTFYWDKLKEVPTRLLERWQQDSMQNEGLPLRDILDMAQLSDDQLDAAAVDTAVRECWNMQEWALVGSHSLIRPPVRLLTGLTAQQLDAAQQADGLALTKLPPSRQEEWATFLIQQRHIPPQMLEELQLHVDYVPKGHYVWSPMVPDTTRYEDAARLPLISNQTAEGALAAAKHVYYGASSGQIRRTSGLLAITLFRQTAAGRQNIVEFGKPPILFIPTNPQR